MRQGRDPGEHLEMAATRPGVSVVVPVYNSEPTLHELTQRISAVLSTVSPDYEILFINDGSRDRSWQRVVQLASAGGRVRGVSLMRNYGQHNALLCGIREARYETIVTIDDDLQNPPEEIPKLLDALTDDVDVVYGCPDEEQHGLWRNSASRITKLALKTAMGAEIAERVSAFRAFRTRVREAFANYVGPSVSIDTLLTWGTSHFDFVVVRHDPRIIGDSNYTFRKLMAHALNMMTGFSTLPLQFASFVGFTFTVFGLVVLSFVLLRYLVQGTTVPGFPFLASVIAIFSGAQLFALGVIGEYLARMHFRLMDRPPYCVRDRAGVDEAAKIS